ncbi:MBL fold metallo-hydrolase [Saccharicrinis aurantiacus]|uniref:MBL fold metallo-hydrolase n=1 Tax=Saccharicrinis aurantiacus TaxID=1849719 RepID=UPI001C9E32A0|nr:MBL fold metallo-hydrolase [Saccharicrinis aurantiacus]
MNIKKTMVIAFLIIATIVLGVAIFMRTPRFGKHPSGARLALIEQSPNYENGQFKNLTPTPMLAEGVNYWTVLKEFLFSGTPKEPQHIPTKKTDLKSLNPSENVTVWMGHSSYFMQLDGKKILVDPVMSGNASPVSFTTKAYKGSDVYTTDDIPEIDYLFITHDHWDHLDYKTILELKPKIKTVICGLGVGAHFEHWGFEPSIIKEGDWYESVPLAEGFVAHITPTRHFSGRGFKRNQTLWASFAFFTPSSKIFIGGDGGYDEHFANIGEKYGPFDVAILENGQYDSKWKYIHMIPNEPIQASADLKAKALLPVHSGKFTLANHDWDEPLTKITSGSNSNLRIITPMIGEQVNLNDTTQLYTQWWKDVK